MLAVSAITLLPILVPAAPYNTMMPRIAEAVGQGLRGLEIGEAKVADEEDAMRDAAGAHTNNRRVLGSMNDFASTWDAYLR